MPKMRTFTFNDGSETKTVEALSYKKAVRSFQGSTKAKSVRVEWEAKKGGLYEKQQTLPYGRAKKIARWSYIKLHKLFVAHESQPKKTSIGNNHSRTKFSSMNKSKKRSYKKYRGQGK